MNNGIRIQLTKNLMAAVLGAAIVTVTMIGPAHAQDPTAGGQQPGGGQGFGGGGRRGGGGPGGMPFASGTVTGGDAAAGTITITSTNGGGTQTIKVNQDTTFDAQETISVKDLKIGDAVVVQGIPATLTASTITAGDPPAFMARGGRGNRGAAGAAAPGGAPIGGAPGQPAGNGVPAQPATPPVTANANATGKVVSTSPLTIHVGETVDVVLKIAKDAKITRYKKTQFSNLKVGDTIFAMGQTAQDGTFNATGVGVNMQMGGGRGMMGMMGGGFGGPGGGGFGGPGGGGFGGGGGRGGRRGGGGGAGANGGGAAGGNN